jgi:hypothetical protein
MFAAHQHTALEDVSSLARYILSKPRAILLDLRGTVLHGEDDKEVLPSLLHAIIECLYRGIDIAFVSGCSRETVELLVIAPWKRLKGAFEQHFSTAFDGRLLIYLATGSEGYFVTSDLTLAELPMYASTVLVPDDAARIVELLERISKRHGAETRIEVRCAQVNFYVQASRKVRQAIAFEINEALMLAGIDQLHILIPSSKEVIDVCGSSKMRAVHDLISRLGIGQHEQALIISDSLQHDGGDVEMLKPFENPKAVHVGEKDADLHPATLHIQGGPGATLRVLSHVLSLS